MTKRRVVVTGLGCISPVGNDVESTWDNIKAGVSGVGEITYFDTSDFGTKIGAEVKDFDATAYIDKKETKKMDRFIQLLR